MILWRVSRFLELNGAGGLDVGGRWHSAGRRIVYCAEHSALALLEVLAQLERSHIPPAFQLLEIEAPDGLEVTGFPGETAPDTPESRAWGDSWLELMATPLAKVPSVVAPRAFNFLINPAHPDGRRIRLAAHAHYAWDSRLFG